MATRKAAATTAVADPEEQVTIRLTGEVEFKEWLTTYQAGQEITVKRSLLTDKRLVGKFEEV